MKITHYKNDGDFDFGSKYSFYYDEQGILKLYNDEGFALEKVANTTVLIFTFSHFSV